MSQPFSFTFGGQVVAARPGMTVGAALAATGEHRLRETRLGPERGLFCGMGVCQDCLVTIDGRPGQRACATKVESGMVISRQMLPGELPDVRIGAPPVTFDRIGAESADVLVIGGGAGGLSAALHARQAGLDVLLLDERPVTGGQYFKQPSAAEPSLDAQQEQGRALRAAVERAGVRIMDGAEILSPLDELKLLATMQRKTFIVRGKALIVATGAYERAQPCPGWTLPGVMTTGAIQTLWRSYRVLPGKRILIAGNGPLNLQVGCEVMAGGADVPAVIESAPLLAPGRIGAAARMVMADGGLARKGLAMLRQASAYGARLRFGQVIRRITQTGEGLAVETGDLSGGPSECWTVDAVGMGYGFLPSNELLRALGAGHRYDTVSGMLRTVRTAECETTISQVFAVGDCAGLGGAPVAMAEGAIAGLAAARRLGAVMDAGTAHVLRKAGDDLARHRRFQRALWSFYAAPRPGLTLADDDTLVCRCEELGKRELLATIGDAEPSIGEVKRRTRCGMGRCQGRYCGPLVVEEMAARSGVPVTERDFFAPRGPFKPVTISDLVGGLSP
jgi:D-hydroxyproline dehydrogenase subunit alpha